MDEPCLGDEKRERERLVSAPPGQNRQTMRARSTTTEHNTIVVEEKDFSVDDRMQARSKDSLSSVHAMQI